MVKKPNIPAPRKVRDVYAPKGNMPDVPLGKTATQAERALAKDIGRGLNYGQGPVPLGDAIRAPRSEAEGTEAYHGTVTGRDRRLSGGMAVEPEFSFFYRVTMASEYSKRVWRSNWAGDMFEVLHADEFEALQAMCKRFAIPLIEADE